MSASLYKSIYCVLNQILSYGNRYCGTPKIHLKTEKLRTVPKPVQTINATDQQKLCHYLLSDLDSCKLGILICLYMGLRLGNLCLGSGKISTSREKRFILTGLSRGFRSDRRIRKRFCMKDRPKRSALSARSRFRNFSLHFFSLIRMMGFMY